MKNRIFLFLLTLFIIFSISTTVSADCGLVSGYGPWTMSNGVVTFQAEIVRVSPEVARFSWDIIIYKGEGNFNIFLHVDDSTRPGHDDWGDVVNLYKGWGEDYTGTSTFNGEAFVNILDKGCFWQLDVQVFDDRGVLIPICAIKGEIPDCGSWETPTDTPTITPTPTDTPTETPTDTPTPKPAKAGIWVKVGDAWREPILQVRIVGDPHVIGSVSLSRESITITTPAEGVEAILGHEKVPGGGVSINNFSEIWGVEHKFTSQVFDTPWLAGVWFDGLETTRDQFGNKVRPNIGAYLVRLSSERGDVVVGPFNLSPGDRQGQEYIYDILWIEDVTVTVSPTADGHPVDPTVIEMDRLEVGDEKSFDVDVDGQEVTATVRVDWTGPGWVNGSIQVEASPQWVERPVEEIKQGAVDGTYVVCSGDTLANIGEAFGVSFLSIADANGIINPDLINVGQVLVIPGVG